MKKYIGTLVLLFFLLGVGVLYAQTGSVVWFTATAGTTLAGNCPTAPANPSLCLVGDGFWVWQNAASGWYKPLATAPAGGVTSVNGKTGAVTIAASSTTTTTLQ